MEDPNKYDPNVVIQAAQDKLSQNNDLDGGQMIFQSALLTWVDDAREIANGNGDMDYDTMQQAIVTLWLAYAEYLSSARQYKSAMEAYDQAVNCPIAGTVGTIWLSYAQFAQEREKKKTAQQVYIRALVGSNGHDGAVQEEQDRDILWQAFLEMMQMNNPELTLSELQQAIESEQQQKTTSNQDTSSGLLGEIEADVVGEMEDAGPATKRLKTGSPEKDVEPQKIHSVAPEAVQADANAFLEALKQSDIPPDVLAAWLIRDGQSSAQAPEPLFAPAPPKLSDPTGKDILGIETASNLNSRLQSSSGAVVLKVCEAMWMLTALTEYHTSETISQLDESLKQAHEQREANFSYRIATAANDSVAAAIKANIDQDRQTFQKACQGQRQKVVQDVAWQLRRLLCAQQQILTQLQIPGFNGPTVDASALTSQASICSYLHAAFFLRNRIGADPHIALLKAQAARLEQQKKEQEQQQQNSRGPSPFPPAGSQQQQHQMAYPLQYGNNVPPPPPQGYSGIPPPPPPPAIPSYPAYVPGQQMGMMHSQQQNRPPHMMQQQQQTHQQNPYGGGSQPPYNYYPPS